MSTGAVRQATTRCALIRQDSLSIRIHEVLRSLGKPCRFFISNIFETAREDARTTQERQSSAFL